MKNITLVIISLISFNLSGQINESADYSNPQEYEIGGIMVEGANNLNDNTLIAITNLSIGEKIKVPGDEITKAITKLWEQGLFSDANIVIEKIVGNTVFLKIKLTENPRLSKFKFIGEKVRKSEITSIKEELKLMRGKVITQNLINNSINSIEKYYINKGFYNVDVECLTTTDTTKANSENLIFKISKGEKIKIKTITIKGRSQIANTKKNYLTVKIRLML